MKRRHDEQSALLEKRTYELEKQITDLTSDLSRVTSDLRDSSANYELRIETLETKLTSSNNCLQVKRGTRYRLMQMNLYIRSEIGKDRVTCVHNSSVFCATESVP